MKEERNEEKPAINALEYLKDGQMEVTRRYLRVERVMQSTGLCDRTNLDRLRMYTARDMFRRYIAYASRYWGNIEIEEALKELKVYGHEPITEQSLKEAKESLRARKKK